MATKGPNFAGTGQSRDFSSRVEWLNPSRIVAQDSSYSTCEMSSQGSDYLVASNFGFNVPTDATIVGLFAEFRIVSASGNVPFLGGFAKATTDDPNLPSAWFFDATTTEAWRSIGGSEDVPTGDAPWLPSDINGSGFSAIIRTNSGTITDTVSVDAVRVTVYYTPTAPSITTTTLPSGVQGEVYSQTVEVSGGDPPYVWAIVSGVLPDGLSLGAATGTISGTPTVVDTFNFTVQVTDDSSQTDTQALSIQIDEPPPSASGVVYRYSDTSNYWRAYVNTGTAEMVLEKVVAGVVTTVASAPITVGTGGEIHAMFQGSRHRVAWNFQLVIDAEDSALSTNTTVGLYSSNQANGIRFRDFYANGL